MEQEQKQENHESIASGLPETTNELTTALAEVQTRVTDLEKVIAHKDDEIATLIQSKDSLDGKIHSLNRSLAEAVSGYRTMVVQANPEIPAEMVIGDTVEAIVESMKQARALVNKVRKNLETDLLATHFPAGAPERGTPVLDLSPREKIRQGIETRK
jgi:chromosome segregation ATPase